MIQCKPTGICIWRYLLEGPNQLAHLDYYWASESGSIHIDSECFEVVGHGMLSGQWTLQRQGKQVAFAQKTAFVRSFALETAEGSLVLQASSFLGKEFLLESGRTKIARFFPQHAFTSEPTSSCLPTTPIFSPFPFHSGWSPYCGVDKTTPTPGASRVRFSMFYIAYWLAAATRCRDNSAVL